MRTRRKGIGPPFVAGVAVGLAVAGVTLLIAATVRRSRERRRQEQLRYIDREPDEQELAVLPRVESTATEEPPRLESELPEFSPESQRW